MEPAPLNRRLQAPRALQLPHPLQASHPRAEARGRPDHVGPAGSDGDRPSEQTFVRAGAVGFLNKPVERDRVLSVLRGALERPVS